MRLCTLRFARLLSASGLECSKHVPSFPLMTVMLCLVEGSRVYGVGSHLKERNRGKGERNICKRLLFANIPPSTV